MAKKKPTRRLKKWLKYKKAFVTFGEATVEYLRYLKSTSEKNQEWAWNKLKKFEETGAQEILQSTSDVSKVVENAKRKSNIANAKSNLPEKPYGPEDDLPF